MRSYTQQEAEEVARRYFRRLGVREVKAMEAWRGTWAEHLIRGTEPKPVTAAKVPSRTLKALASGPAEAEAFLVSRVWGALTEEPHRAYREAFEPAMERQHRILRSRYTVHDAGVPWQDPEVRRAIAMIGVANDIEWSRWYPTHAQFHAKVENEGCKVYVTGWMWPQ